MRFVQRPLRMARQALWRAAMIASQPSSAIAHPTSRMSGRLVPNPSQPQIFPHRGGRFAKPIGRRSKRRSQPARQATHAVGLWARNAAPPDLEVLTASAACEAEALELEVLGSSSEPHQKLEMNYRDYLSKQY